MKRVVVMMVTALAAVLALGAQTQAEEGKSAPKCQTAEINPVTGRVLCIKPLGAPVEAPPSDIAPDCKADESRGQWTWAPTCKDQPKG
jgi:hypothetical protein